MLRAFLQGRSRRWATAGAFTLLAGGLGACGGSSGSPTATLAAFVSDWQRGNTAAMASLVDRPPPGLAAAISGYTADLHAGAGVHRAGPVLNRAGHRSAAITSTYQLPGAGPWTVTTGVSLVRRGGRWEVEWSPSVVAPGLAAGQRLAATYSWAPRAPILGSGGTALTTDANLITVGVEGSRVKDPAALTQLLESSGAPASSVTSALAAAATHPSYFEPVFNLSDAAYAAIGGNSGALHAAAGTVFRHVTARTALTPGLATDLVGSVGPITAEQLKELGPPYTSTSVVGQSGLEAAYEKQLAGTPGAAVEVLDPGGRTVRNLATIAPRPGRPVVTGIDPAVQKAAEAALATLGQAQVPPPPPAAGSSPSPASGSPASGDAVALVAVSLDQDQVLASAGLPAGSTFDAGLDGEFPPGSTFKILTSTSLFQSGLAPSSPATCPPSVTVDGKAFHNAEGDRPVSDLAEAFTESCNTAYIQLATAHLQPATFPAVARLYGLGVPFHMGLAAFAGRVPAPAAGADLAATSIGQGSVVVSPLSMAMVAAAVGSGTARPPRLVAGTADEHAVGHPIPPSVLAALRPMMASVVTSGTAAGTGLPAGTFAKTGTAEYGSGPNPAIDAWLVGYRGNVAFAMVVQNSRADGGPTDGPVVARFLDALATATG